MLRLAGTFRRKGHNGHNEDRRMARTVTWTVRWKCLNRATISNRFQSMNLQICHDIQLMTRSIAFACICLNSETWMQDYPLVLTIWNILDLDVSSMMLFCACGFDLTHIFLGLRLRWCEVTPSYEASQRDVDEAVWDDSSTTKAQPSFSGRFTSSNLTCKKGMQHDSTQVNCIGSVFGANCHGYVPEVCWIHERLVCQ